MRSWFDLGRKKNIEGAAPTEWFIISQPPTHCGCIACLDAAIGHEVHWNDPDSAKKFPVTSAIYRQKTRFAIQVNWSAASVSTAARNNCSASELRNASRQASANTFGGMA